MIYPASTAADYSKLTNMSLSDMLQSRLEAARPLPSLPMVNALMTEGSKLCQHVKDCVFSQQITSLSTLLRVFAKAQVQMPNLMGGVAEVDLCKLLDDSWDKLFHSRPKSGNSELAQESVVLRLISIVCVTEYLSTLEPEKKAAAQLVLVSCQTHLSTLGKEFSTDSIFLRCLLGVCKSLGVSFHYFYLFRFILLFFFVRNVSRTRSLERSFCATLSLSAPTHGKPRIPSLNGRRTTGFCFRPISKTNRGASRCMRAG